MNLPPIERNKNTALIRMTPNQRKRQYMNMRGNEEIKWAFRTLKTA